VGDKYQLAKSERLLLYRCIYSSKESEEHRKKLVPLKDVQNQKIAIDGYNVIITVESMLKNKPLILCDDGYVRDISAVHRKYKQTKITVKTVKTVIETLKSNNIKEAVFLFDAQISKSGELASLTRKILKNLGLTGEALTVKKADKKTINQSNVVASSDAVIINKAEKIVDLAGEIIKQKAPEKLLRITEI
jgi:hypothetical protein